MSNRWKYALLAIVAGAVGFGVPWAVLVHRGASEWWILALLIGWEANRATARWAEARWLKQPVKEAPEPWVRPLDINGDPDLPHLVAEVSEALELDGDETRALQDVVLSAHIGGKLAGSLEALRPKQRSSGWRFLSS